MNFKSSLNRYWRKYFEINNRLVNFKNIDEELAVILIEDKLLDEFIEKYVDIIEEFLDVIFY